MDLSAFHQSGYNILYFILLYSPKWKNGMLSTSFIECCSSRAYFFNSEAAVFSSGSVHNFNCIPSTTNKAMYYFYI